jgi:hypothetical protein
MKFFSPLFDTYLRLTGLTGYLYERGFLVMRKADELDRVRLLYGSRHYRKDELELILF